MSSSTTHGYSWLPKTIGFRCIRAGAVTRAFPMTRPRSRVGFLKQPRVEFEEERVSLLERLCFARAAVRELEAAGVELLGGQVDERGGGWRHFRAPDGNVYELTSG